MELLCPNCMQKLTIPDQFAGQLMKCPLCAGTFSTPALPPGPGLTPAIPPIPPTSASAPPGSQDIPISAPYGLAPEPQAPAPPLPFQAPASPTPKPPVPPKETKPPPPPGDYTRSWTLWINPAIVALMPPAGLTALFLLAFLPWLTDLQPRIQGSETPTAIISSTSFNLWSLAFTRGPASFLFYVIVVIFLAWPLSIASFLMGRNLIPTPPALLIIVPWRSVIIAALALLGWVSLLVDYLHVSWLTPGTLWLTLAFYGHFLVVLSLALEYWLEMRRARNLPWPKVEFRW